MCSLHPQEELQSTIEPLNFLDFPEEILWLPFQFLRARDLMQLSSTCKQLYESLSSRRGKLLWSNRVKKQVHPYVIDLHAQEAGEACTASWLWWRKLALLTEEMQSLQLEATVTSVPFQSIGRGPLTAGLGVHDHFAAGAHHAHERPPTLSRSGHTTTTLLNGDVVIVGGVVPQSHYWSVVLEPLVVSSDGQSVQQILTQQRLAHDAEVDRAPRAPCPRLRHAICRIGPATLLLHGGHDLDQFGSAYDDLWSMEITQSAPVGPARPRGSARAMLPYHVTWTRLHTTGSVPGGRSKHTLCATPDGARVVLFGGHETEPGDPTVFVLDVRALCWTAVCTTGDVPQRNQLHVSVWCADTSSMVVFGGGVVDTMFHGFNEAPDNAAMEARSLCLESFVWRGPSGETTQSSDELSLPRTVERTAHVELSPHHVLVYGGQRSLDCRYSNRVDLLDLRSGHFVQLYPTVVVPGGLGSAACTPREQRRAFADAQPDDSLHSDVGDVAGAFEPDPASDTDHSQTARGVGVAAALPCIAGACFAGFQTIGGLEIGLGNPFMAARSVKFRIKMREQTMPRVDLRL
eukprot:m.359743 g.359743  ORF g.359743 m.359743 type:complete len:574 (+) comp20762_c0_seq12:297-2018(+)